TSAASGRRRTVFTTTAPASAVWIAFWTPVDEIGSSETPASPTRIADGEMQSVSRYGVASAPRTGLTRLAQATYEPSAEPARSSSYAAEALPLTRPGSTKTRASTVPSGSGTPQHQASSSA